MAKKTTKPKSAKAKAAAPKPAKRKTAKRKTAKRKSPIRKQIDVTDAFHLFLEDFRHTTSLFAAMAGIIVRTTINKDERAKKDSDVLGKIKSGVSPMVAMDDIFQNDPSIEPHLVTLYEMILCRIADNFQSYIAELLTAIYTKYPDKIVNSGIGIKPEHVFDTQNIDELRGRVIENHVRGFIYESLPKYVKKLQQPDQLDFALLENPKVIDFASDIFLIRNLIVHNRGVINHTFMDRVRVIEQPIKVGMRPNIEKNFLDLASSFIISNARDTDLRAQAKFKLETPITIEWEEEEEES